MINMLDIMGLIGLTAGLALAQSNAVASEQLIEAERRAESPAVMDWSFDLDAPADGQQVRLSLLGRIDSEALAGNNPFLSVRVNGHPLVSEHLLNKPNDFRMLNGSDATWYFRARWRLCYSPDFSDDLRTARIAYAIPDADPYQFVWDITDFVKPGSNDLRIQHHRILPDGSTVVLRDIKVEVGELIEPAPSSDAPRPAPTGPLPVFIADASPAAASFRAGVAEDGSIVIDAAGTRIAVESRTSVQGGGWVPAVGGDPGRIKPVNPGQSVTLDWQGDQYRVERKITAGNNHMLIEDTFTNTTDQIVGVMLEHSATGDAPLKDAWLHGARAFAEKQNGGDPRNPSIIAQWEKLTLGLFPENDLFRLQHETRLDEPSIRLINRQLGLPPGGAHTLSWSVYPVVDGDYWDVINTVRQNWGSNITLPGPMIFTHGSYRYQESAEALAGWTRRLGIPYQCSHQTHYIDNRDQLAEGTDLLNATKWWGQTDIWAKKVRGKVPGFNNLIYLHCEIGTEEGSDMLYADSKHLLPDGQHRKTPYHYPIYMYLSTLENSYGKALQKTVRQILANPEVDGFYVDEFLPLGEQIYQYGDGWDQATTIINPTTHVLTGTRMNAALMQLPWRLWLIDEVRAHGKTIVGNSPPIARSLLDKQVPFFTETFSSSQAVVSHLATPWALGNGAYNLPAFAAKARALLDYGALITPHVWTGDLPEEGQFFLPKMYPLTPIELGPGMILGRERIVTNRSGTYGWADGEPGEVYVYDGVGRPVPNPDVIRTTHDGRPVVELRMPSDHLAVIVNANPADGTEPVAEHP